MRTMRTPAATPDVGGCDHCTVSVTDVGQAIGQYGIPNAVVLNEAAKRGMVVTAHWDGRPGLSVPDARRFVAEYQAHLDNHNQTEAEYRAYLAEQEQDRARRDQEAQREAWDETMRSNQKLSDAARAAAATENARRLLAAQEETRKKLGDMSFEAFEKRKKVRS